MWNLLAIEPPGSIPPWMLLLAFTIALVALAMLGLALGVLVSGKPIEKGCGKFSCEGGCAKTQCPRGPSDGGPA